MKAATLEAENTYQSGATSVSFEEDPIVREIRSGSFGAPWTTFNFDLLEHLGAQDISYVSNLHLPSYPGMDRILVELLVNRVNALETEITSLKSFVAAPVAKIEAISDVKAKELIESYFEKNPETAAYPHEVAKKLQLPLNQVIRIFDMLFAEEFLV